MNTSSNLRANRHLRQERTGRNWRQQDLAEHLGTSVDTVKRWERGSQQPGAYFRAKLCALFGKSAQELGLLTEQEPLAKEEASSRGQASLAPTDPLALWMVPYRRNPHFTGRDDLLAHLAQQLSCEKQRASTPRRAILSQPQAIKGLGGIGKTQIAVEYAYRAREQDHYTHTLWIHAANEETILSSFVALAQLLPEGVVHNEKDQRKLVAAVLRWLEMCQEPWLLIVDNADDVALIQPYLPTQGQGSILLTTRAQAVAALASSLDVVAMGVMEGTQFLLHRTQRLDATDEQQNEAANVVIALDGFPLALDQAGAYIEETRCSFADYLQLYHRRRHALLSRRGIQSTHYPDSVATTWSLSFQQVEQKSPAAADLLRLCAFLSPDHIPEELLREGVSYWPPALREAVSDPFAFNQMLEELLKFSLIKRLAEEHTLSLHRLIQVVQREKMDRQEQEHWATCAVSATNAVFPADPQEIATWPQCQRYLEQVQVCDVLIREYEVNVSDAADLLDRAGTYLYEHALYVQAESLFQQGLRIWERLLGSEHVQCAEPLNGLAEVYRAQGKYEQAEALFLRAIHIHEQQVGPEHLQSTSSHSGELHSGLSGLAEVYRAQGKYEQAEALFLRALHIREQQLGPEHPLVAYTLNDLAILYKEQSKDEQAEALFLRALHIREQQLGPEHPLVAYPLDNLGNLYHMQGKDEQAEALFLRAIHIREQQLGLEHPLVAYLLNNLGGLYLDRGNYEQAERRLQRALRIIERRLGSEHGAVAYPLTNLRELYLTQGNDEQAERCLQQALRVWEQQLGPEHLQVAYPLNELASLARRQGKYEQAESLYLRVLSIREHRLGSFHPDTQQSRNKYVSLLHEMGRVCLIQECGQEKTVL